MALLIAKKEEISKYGNICWYAYFDETPSKRELKKLQLDGFSIPEREDDEVARRAGLQRWYVSQSV